MKTTSHIISAASVLEVDIKTKGKHNNLTFTVDEYVKMCHDTGFYPMPLREKHITEANRLILEGQGEHKDPFDRMLLAQAIVEGMYFMTADGKIPHYKQDCVIAV